MKRDTQKQTQHNRPNDRPATSPVPGLPPHWQELETGLTESPYAEVSRGSFAVHRVSEHNAAFIFNANDLTSSSGGIQQAYDHIHLVLGWDRHGKTRRWAGGDTHTTKFQFGVGKERVLQARINASASDELYMQFVIPLPQDVPVRFPGIGKTQTYEYDATAQKLTPSGTVEDNVSYGFFQTDNMQGPPDYNSYRIERTDDGGRKFVFPAEQFVTLHKSDPVALATLLARVIYRHYWPTGGGPTESFLRNNLEEDFVGNVLVAKVPMSLFLQWRDQEAHAKNAQQPALSNIPDNQLESDYIPLGIRLLPFASDFIDEDRTVFGPIQDEEGNYQVQSVNPRQLVIDRVRACAIDIAQEQRVKHEEMFNKYLSGGYSELLELKKSLRRDYMLEVGKRGLEWEYDDALANPERAAQMETSINQAAALQDQMRTESPILSDLRGPVEYGANYGGILMTTKQQWIDSGRRQEAEQGYLSGNETGAALRLAVQQASDKWQRAHQTAESEIERADDVPGALSTRVPLYALVGAVDRASRQLGGGGYTGSSDTYEVDTNNAASLAMLQWLRECENTQATWDWLYLGFEVGLVLASIASGGALALVLGAASSATGLAVSTKDFAAAINLHQTSTVGDDLVDSDQTEARVAWGALALILSVPGGREVSKGIGTLRRLRSGADETADLAAQSQRTQRWWQDQRAEFSDATQENLEDIALQRGDDVADQQAMVLSVLNTLDDSAINNFGDEVPQLLNTLVLRDSGIVYDLHGAPAQIIESLVQARRTFSDDDEMFTVVANNLADSWAEHRHLTQRQQDLATDAAAAERRARVARGRDARQLRQEGRALREQASALDRPIQDFQRYLNEPNVWQRVQQVIDDTRGLVNVSFDASVISKMQFLDRKVIMGLDRASNAKLATVVSMAKSLPEAPTAVQIEDFNLFAEDIAFARWHKVFLAPKELASFRRKADEFQRAATEAGASDLRYMGAARNLKELKRVAPADVPQELERRGFTLWDVEYDALGKEKMMYFLHDDGTLVRYSPQTIPHPVTRGRTLNPRLSVENVRLDSDGLPHYQNASNRDGSGVEFRFTGNGRPLPKNRAGANANIADFVDRFQRTLYGDERLPDDAFEASFDLAESLELLWAQQGHIYPRGR